MLIKPKLKSRKSWSNVSGSVTVQPNHYSYPASVNEIQAEVSRCAEEFQRLRVAGSGSALSPLCWTDENLMSLEHFHGIESVDSASQRIWVRAGTRLGWLARALADRGYAIANWRGSERQTLGGALTTGLHSGGAGLQSLSAQVTAVSLVGADGSVKTIRKDANAELFDVARLALGALGVVTHAELQCVPAFRLQRTQDQVSLDELLARIDEYNASCHAFSFRWQAYSGRAQLQFLRRTHEPLPTAQHPLHEARSQALRGMRDWLLTQAAQRLPGAAERAGQLYALSRPQRSGVLDAHGLPAEEIGATPRQVIEYSLPVAALHDTLRQMERVIRALSFPALLPINVRFGAADPLWLSPLHARDSALITVGVPLRTDGEAYFEAMTEIFDRHDGRPSWHTGHRKTAADLVQLYPRFNEFLDARRKLDPRGMFLNPHLMSLFGVEAL